MYYGTLSTQWGYLTTSHHSWEYCTTIKQLQLGLNMETEKPLTLRKEYGKAVISPHTYLICTVRPS